MPRRKTQLDAFEDLTWLDIEQWAGGRVASRGRSYHRQGRVSGLAKTDDGSLIAWVAGTHRYATSVGVDGDGLPNSLCTCPYGLQCKHGVAVVLAYMEKVEAGGRIPKAKEGDERTALLGGTLEGDAPTDGAQLSPDDAHQKINGFLEGRTKAQLIELIHSLSEQHPQVAVDLTDRMQLGSGQARDLVSRLREEIREVGSEPGWQDYWRGEGFMPDYSGIRRKLEELLEAGHPDEVLALGGELVTVGTGQVEESHDEGETGMQIAECMPVIVDALEGSSLAPADKLEWALDVLLDDECDLCEAFGEYLSRRHPRSAWNALADRLLGRLDGLGPARAKDDYTHRYTRDRLSDWAIHALQRCGRKNEIIPLCVAEADGTGRYDRLVKLLIDARRHEEAECWIQKGIRATEGELPGIAASLRERLREIRRRGKDWPAVAAMHAEEFVRSPSREDYTSCAKACRKAGVWPRVRELLLGYLESGVLPWTKKGWPLPESGLDRPGRDRQTCFPLVEDLIDIALLEKKPEQVLKWYDQRPKGPSAWWGVSSDAVASAVQKHAPSRAVAIWQGEAEQLIAQVKPKAYMDAAGHLRKAARVMQREKKRAEWESYLRQLREEHRRKRRLMEILDGLEGKPIMSKTR